MKEQPPPYSTSPPPAGFNPPPPQHSGHPAPSHTVIVTTTATPISLGPDPARMTCPYCHANIVTSVESEANSKTHLFAILLCLFM
ncbi:hypothetical protein ABEB36_000670 [Hypothenemus hampei]|uniref:LITAF domain-containing protein n=1 Tax=Hypothenemus hampei TaxID=57062 RepID=A0ABD1FC28_HYPHA